MCLQHPSPALSRSDRSVVVKDTKTGTPNAIQSTIASAFRNYPVLETSVPQLLHLSHLTELTDIALKGNCWGFGISSPFSISDSLMVFLLANISCYSYSSCLYYFIAFIKEHLQDLNRGGLVAIHYLPLG